MKTVSNVLCAAVVLVSGGACAKAPSGGAIRLIVPFGAGSSVDSTARPFALALSEALGQPVVVDNRAGAEGVIGVRAVLNAPADGLTMLFTSNSVPTLLPVLKKVAPFDPADLIPVCAISKAPMNVWMRASLPHKTLPEFIADAKAHPQKYTYATSTGLTRLTAEWLQQIAGIELRGVPYKATSQALVDIQSGQVDLMMADVSTAKAGHQSGRIRPMVAADAKRAGALQEAPSAPEAGVAGFNVSVWFATYLPRNTPAAVVAKMRQTVRQAANSAQVHDGDKAGGREAMVLCGDELARYQDAEIARWRKLVATARIETD
jgi:tripartite-type tricarboxylate transporter receptor subunit TctC